MEHRGSVSGNKGGAKTLVDVAAALRVLEEAGTNGKPGLDSQEVGSLTTNRRDAHANGCALQIKRLQALSLVPGNDAKTVTLMTSPKGTFHEC